MAGTFQQRTVNPIESVILSYHVRGGKQRELLFLQKEYHTHGASPCMALQNLLYSVSLG